MRNWSGIIGLWLAACGLAAAQDAADFAAGGTAATATATEATLSQDARRLRADSLLQLIYHGPVERSRQHHRAFGQTLEALVRNHPEPAPYLWENLEGLMYFKSTDGRLQLLNWSVPNINGTSSYGGLVWVKQPSAANGPATADSAAYLFYPLQDFSSYQPYPEALTLTPAQWWGAYYYQAVEHRQGDTLLLTLIGVNHSQNRYAQKVIDVLQLLPDGTVAFGAPIFKREALPQSVPPADKGVTAIRPQEAAYPNAYIGYKPQGADDNAAIGAPTARQTPAMHRIVFRYNPRTDLILRYDYQAYRRYHGKKAKETPAYMIVCDRLMHDPLSLDQTAARLVPAGGVYDAFVFQAPYWYPVEDVIARNPDAERGARHR
ncbi:MAG: hypothetical protein K2K51_04340 [Bacteroidales bacterium]|nr:hypothetical protein [Bacteroidales bacterium]